MVMTQLLVASAMVQVREPDTIDRMYLTPFLVNVASQLGLSS
jgi:hypothetical protein